MKQFLTGKIKFYSKDKGYGFIYCKTKNQDYYFNIKDINNGDIPSANDIVIFNTINNSKGISAVDITITSKANSNKSLKEDSRVICNKCKRKIIPRVVFQNGRAMYSVCPFCGRTYKIFINFYISLFIIFLGIVLFFIFFIKIFN